ncbi:unnamed protein product, partial [Vitis vinifera]
MLGLITTMDGGSSYATTIHRTTTSDSILTEDYRTTSNQVLSYHRSDILICNKLIISIGQYK